MVDPVLWRMRITWPDGSVTSWQTDRAGSARLGDLDAMVRLVLTVRRLGGSVTVESASPSMRELITLAGIEPDHAQP